MSEAHKTATFVELAADVVAAYVSNNALGTKDLPALIADVHAALIAASSGNAKAAVKSEPAIPVKRSVTDDYIVCLEDGRKLKSLKRHLRVTYNLTPSQYRERWGLPADYPMVCANYSKFRSDMAKRTKLGQSSGKRR